MCEAHQLNYEAFPPRCSLPALLNQACWNALQMSRRTGGLNLPPLPSLPAISKPFSLRNLGSGVALQLVEVIIPPGHRVPLLPLSSLFRERTHDRPEVDIPWVHDLLPDGRTDGPQPIM